MKRRDCLKAGLTLPLLPMLLKAGPAFAATRRKGAAGERGVAGGGRVGPAVACSGRPAVGPAVAVPG